jgi:hypothetical protein
MACNALRANAFGDTVFKHFRERTEASLGLPELDEPVEIYRTPGEAPKIGLFNLTKETFQAGRALCFCK